MVICGLTAEASKYLTLATAEMKQSHEISYKSVFYCDCFIILQLEVPPPEYMDNIYLCFCTAFGGITSSWRLDWDRSASLLPQPYANCSHPTASCSAIDQQTARKENSLWVQYNIGTSKDRSNDGPQSPRYAIGGKIDKTAKSLP